MLDSTSQRSVGDDLEGRVLLPLIVSLCNFLPSATTILTLIQPWSGISHQRSHFSSRPLVRLSIGRRPKNGFFCGVAAFATPRLLRVSCGRVLFSQQMRSTLKNLPDFEFVPSESNTFSDGVLKKSKEYTENSKRKNVDKKNFCLLSLFQDCRFWTSLGSIGSCSLRLPPDAAGERPCDCGTTRAIAGVKGEHCSGRGE